MLAFLRSNKSFLSAVIKELDGDLARVICLLYLVLRGLDTFEDDMTLSDDIKQPVLRTFHQKLTLDGWIFDGCGPAEKDRQLLVEFDNVIAELGLLDSTCGDVIIDITQKMETGMANVAHRAATSTTTPYLASIEEYDLYCHYAAGLVGEGLYRLFAATEKERPWIANQLVLSNSMGLLLQNTNILRDFREDCDEKRYFWPREIWAAYGFTRPDEMHRRQLRTSAMGPGETLKFEKPAPLPSSCIPAIPSPSPTSSVTLRARFTEKPVPNDPNYLGKIECWVEHHFPSFVSMSKESKTITLKTDDPRSDIVRRDRDLEKERIRRMRGEAAAMGQQDEAGIFSWDLFLFFLGAFGFVFVATAFTTIGGLYYFNGTNWTWSELGANTIGRFMEESEAKVEEFLGK